MKKNRLLRWTSFSLVVVVLALFGFVWFGPVTVGNKKVLVDFILGRGIDPPSAAQAAERLGVADGFQVEIYAEIPLARWPLATASGDLIVARTRATPSSSSSATAMATAGPTPSARSSRTSTSRTVSPSATAGSTSAIAPALPASGSTRSRAHVTGAPTNIVDDFAGDGNHTTKTIGFGLDGWLYVTQGSSCNVCIETDERRATMMRMHPDGTEREIYATGLRNSVGFDWAPWDGAIYATDNGRDLLGDDFPPCELNRVERGKFYGWPTSTAITSPTRTSARRMLRSQRRPCLLCTASARTTHRSVSISCAATFPPGYERTALVALHGSWNRSKLDGYKVVALDFADDGASPSATS